MKKLFLVLFLLLSMVALASCSAANTAERRLEDEGFNVESADEEEAKSYSETYDLEGFKNIHIIYSDSDVLDTEVIAGIIIEYKSRNALEEALDLDDNDEEPNNMYRNIYIIDLSIQYDIIAIIKGE